MVLRELITRLGYNIDDANMKIYNSQLKDISKNAMEYGRNIQMMGLKMTAFFTIPMLMAGKQMLRSASDAKETGDKYNAIFTEIQGKSTETANSLAKDFGIAGSTAKKYLGNTADMLTGFGFGQKEALELSDQTNRLAMDLASFQNLEGGAERASRALTSGLLGERESMKSLGIAILEEDVKKQVALNTSKGITYQTERQAKAVATLQLAMIQSKNAIGDTQRTWNSYANVERRAMESRKKLWEDFGKAFLPIASKFLEFATKAMDWLTSLSDGTKKFVLVMGTLLAVVGPILIALGTMLTLFSGLSGAIAGGGGIALGLKMLGTIAGTVLAPFLNILAVVGLIFLIINDIKSWLNGDQSFLGRFLDAEKYKKDWKDLMDFFKDQVSGDAKDVGKKWAIFFIDGITETLKTLLITGPMGLIFKKILNIQGGKSENVKEGDLGTMFGMALGVVDDSTANEYQKRLYGKSNYANSPGTFGGPTGDRIPSTLRVLMNSLKPTTQNVNVHVNGVGDVDIVADRVVKKITQASDNIAQSNEYSVSTDRPTKYNEKN